MASLPDAVMAGDSVVFGYGVPQDSAVVECLSRELHRPIYNAGIPGLDPAGYYATLEHRYLPIAPTTRLIILGFFGGNDLTDLEGTSWNELAQCRPPASKINSAAFPPWFPDSKPMHSPRRAADWIGYERVFRAEAIEEIAAPQAFRSRVDKIRNDAIHYAGAIEKSSCADRKIRAAIERYRAAVRTGQFGRAENLALTITRDLFSAGCHPTDESLQPLDALFYRTAYYLSGTMVEPKPDTYKRSRYVNYLQKLLERPESASVRDLVARARRLFSAGKIPSDDAQYELAHRLERAFGTA
ncbi:MAG: hypothetical protein DMF59_17850, partial [Acidobacteria bacterium]